jgi:hypothetical protein
MDAGLARILFGTDEVVAEPLALRAGPLTMVYRAGKLLHVGLGDLEIWHGIAFPFRDPDWGTPEPVLTSLDCRTRDDGFHLHAAGLFPTSPPVGLDIDIEGTAEGRIRFSGEAVPAGNIATNRVGLCILHPTSARGARIEVEHADGRVSRSTFPTLIPPWPPFMLVRAIRHEYTQGHWAVCEFHGDVFEFEDQRNNSDASFKTYSRSNLMPRPYVLRARAPIRQSVDLRLEGPWLQPRPPRRSERVVVLPETVVQALPRIGIELSAGDLVAPPHVRQLMRELGPTMHHFALDAEAGSIDWAGVGAQLAELGADLRLDLVSADSAGQRTAIDALGAALRRAGLVPESVAVFPCEQDSIDRARDAFPGSLIGGGTPHYFAQVNRLERLGAVDFVSFTSSPLVHGADDDLVVLSLQSLPSMIATLRDRYPDLPVRIGPSGIGVRKSPLGGQPVTDGLRRVALAKRDPRSQGLFGAAWALGYVAQFASAGADAITLMSLTGDAGVADVSADGSTLRHPVFFLLARLGTRAPIRRVTVSDTSRLAALALEGDGRSELLLANLTSASVEVALEGWPGFDTAAVMDAESWSTVRSAANGWDLVRRRFSAGRCRLAPYAVARFEGPTV